MIHRPELFLLDEPFEGVDAVGARVERLCDRLAIIHDGKLVTQGTMAELRTGTETLEDVFVRLAALTGVTTQMSQVLWMRMCSRGARTHSCVPRRQSCRRMALCKLERAGRSPASIWRKRCRAVRTTLAERTSARALAIAAASPSVTGSSSAGADHAAR